MTIRPKNTHFFPCLFLLGGIVFGQTSNPPPVQNNPTGLSPDQVEFARTQERRRWEQRQQQSMRRLEQDKTLGAVNPKTKKEKPLTREEIKRIDALLVPNSEDLAKYKDFLDGAKTGLFRLFPNLDCESKNVMRVDGNCANFVPGGSIYSFRTRNYVEPDLADLRFDSGELLADGFLSQEIFVPLGNIPLDDVSAASGGMKFLNEFKPEVQNQKVREQFAILAGVVKADDFYYSKRVRAVENMTYAIRIIAYSNQTKIAFRSKNELSRELYRFLAINNDKRIDMTIAFRIIRKDQNGSISILWKEIKRQDAPEIVFQKSEKLADLKDN